jgi:hypothetical protein
MSEDELSAPLGRSRGSKRPCPQLPIAQILVAGLGLIALMFAAWVVVEDDPFGRERSSFASATVLIPPGNISPEQVGRAPEQSAAAASRSSQETQSAEAMPVEVPARRTITIIDGTTGNRREIVIPEMGSSDHATQPATTDEPGYGIAKIAPMDRTAGPGWR